MVRDRNFSADLLTADMTNWVSYKFRDVRGSIFCCFIAVASDLDGNYEGNQNALNLFIYFWCWLKVFYLRRRIMDCELNGVLRMIRDLKYVFFVYILSENVLFEDVILQKFLFLKPEK